MYCHCMCRDQEAWMVAKGLRMEEVIGDGHCLYRCFEFFNNKRNHLEWRKYLADRMEALVEQEPHREKYYLGRANAQLLHTREIIDYMASILHIVDSRVRIVYCTCTEYTFCILQGDEEGNIQEVRNEFTSFKQVMAEMRSSALWGYVDQVMEFSAANEVAILTFQENGSAIYNRHRSVSKVKNTFFMLNQMNSQGKTQLTILCIHISCIQHILTLHVLLTQTGSLVHFNPLIAQEPWTAELQQFVDAKAANWKAEQLPKE